MPGLPNHRVVTVRCPAGHQVNHPVGAVALSHAQGVLIGAEFDCPYCDRPARVSLPPAALAMLADLGVKVADDPLADDLLGPQVYNEHRLALSQRVLRRDVAMPVAER